MILIKDLCHIYNARHKVHSTVGVNNLNLKIDDGEILAVIGISGAGKSTLLRCINRLLEPTSGEVFIDGEDILHCSERRAQAIRRKIGMVFQNFNLLQRSLVINNVLMGRLGYISSLRSLLAGRAYTKDDVDIALDCLRKVGIEDLAYRRVDALSGGQQQRVGVARALAQKPSIILGDEPVSNLDPPRKMEIMNLLSEIQRQEGMTMVISLHDIELAKKYADRIIGMVHGEIVFNSKPEELTDEKIVEIFA